MCLAVALFVMAYRPFGLDASAHMVLGVVIAVLGIWIFKPFGLSYSAGSVLLVSLGMAFGLGPEVVFSGFAQPAAWVLISALLFGYTLQKTGLGRRLALGIIRCIRPSYTSLVLAIVAVGVVLSILTPSVTVRVAIIVPIAMQCCELCGLRRGSRGGGLVVLTAFAMSMIPGSGWFTGTLWGPIISGMVNAVPPNQGLVNFDSWLSVMFLPMAVITLVLVGISLVVFRPDDTLSQEAIESIKNQQLQRISGEEALAAVVLTGAFGMMLLGGLHGLPDASITLGAVFVLFLSRILGTKDLNAGVNWDLVIFIATTLSLGSIFEVAGISPWLSELVLPAIAPLAANPWLFAYSVLGVMFVWRFVDIALFVPTMAVIVPILPAIQNAHGISPLVWVALFVMAGNSFLVPYQNMWAVLSRSLAGDWMQEGPLCVYGVLYGLACIVALGVAVPLWISMGLFG